MTLINRTLAAQKQDALPRDAPPALAEQRLSRERKPQGLQGRPCGSCFYGVIPPKHMYFISTNSSIPYLEPSRPRPDCFTPPKGATSVEMMPVLTPTIPVSKALATRQTRAMSRP